MAPTQQSSGLLATSRPLMRVRSPDGIRAARKRLPGLRQIRHSGFVQPVIDRLAEHVAKSDPGGVLGLYLFGSSVAGGLRPSSDIDLLIVTERSLSLDERKCLVAFLLQFSGRRATIEPGRPLEVTSVVLSDVVPWTYPPVCDFLYGEWLRTQFVEGRVPEPQVNPDLAVLLTTLQQHAEVLRGPDPTSLLRPVPLADLRRSARDSLVPLLSDLIGDERNVLLTLARMLVTLDTGDIVPKDEAVRWILLGLHEPTAHSCLWPSRATSGMFKTTGQSDRGSPRHRYIPRFPNPIPALRVVRSSALARRAARVGRCIQAVSGACSPLTPRPRLHDSSVRWRRGRRSG